MGKVTILLLQRHTAYLDVVSILIRMKHQRAIPRAEIVRALVEFMEKSGIDFTQFSSGAAIGEYLEQYFRAIPNRSTSPPTLLETTLREMTKRQSPPMDVT